MLIAGGSGLIGASLTQIIVELGERPTIFDIAPIHPVSPVRTKAAMLFCITLDNANLNLHWKGKGAFY